VKKFLIFFFIISLAVATSFFLFKKEEKSVKVGVLHSFSGTMSMSEKGVAEATLAAIDEINAAGGVLGRKLIPVVVDGASEPKLFAKKAEELIVKEGVKAIFGCWTSASRKEVKPIVEKYNNLLFYPVQYEGLEESNSIVYLGQLPNQQVVPAVQYAIEHIGREFFLVGSDYIYPRAANIIINDTASILGAKVLGEKYAKLGSYEFGSIVAEIKAKKPKVIFNTLNGDSNTYFFRELYSQDITADKITVISFSIAEEEIKQIAHSSAPEAIVGHLASLSYFDAIKSKENLHFKELLKKRNIQKPTDPMEAAYSGVWLYKQAVEESGSFESAAVKRVLPLQSFKAPGGIINITSANLNAWKNSRIGRINNSLDFEVVLDSKYPIKPQNYPKNRLKGEWNEKLNKFYKDWNNSWKAE
jgi:urea transport system substrate-binding protein